MAAIKGQETINEIASRYDVHPNLVSLWKKLAQEELPGVFADRRSRDPRDEEELRSRLYQQIASREVELAEKKWVTRGDAVRRFAEPGHPLKGASRQSELLGVSRSTLYYRPEPVSVFDLELMNRLDAILGRRSTGRGGWRIELELQEMIVGPIRADFVRRDTETGD